MEIFSSQGIPSRDFPSRTAAGPCPTGPGWASFPGRLDDPREAGSALRHDREFRARARAGGSARVQEAVVRARDRLFQGLAVLARRPAGREGHEELASGHGRQALARVLGRLGVGPVEEDEKLVAAHTHGRFLGTRRAHEEARDPVQDGIARLVPKLVVVLLEVVDIDHDAAPRAARVGVASRELREIAAVPAARERVAQALVEKAFLEALAIGDVDEDALIEDLARLGVEATICGVDDRSGLTVPPADLELEVVHGAVALEAEELGVAALFVHDEVSPLHLARLLE